MEKTNVPEKAKDVRNRLLLKGHSFRVPGSKPAAAASAASTENGFDPVNEWCLCAKWKSLREATRTTDSMAVKSSSK